MGVIWRADAAVTVHEVIDGLRRGGPSDVQGGDIAYTTAITVIERLREKGWLTRERDGRAYRYSPTRTEDEYTAQLMASALETSSDRTAALLSFAGQLDPTEAEELRRALSGGALDDTE